MLHIKDPFSGASHSERSREETRHPVARDVPSLILHIAFNQDSTCFACGKEDGFIVYNCDPPTERFSRLSNIEPNGVGIVEMLFRTNIFALVGGGKNPKFPINKLMLWDDSQTKCIAELEFETRVTGVKLRRDIILVSINDKVYKYNIDDLKLLGSYDTIINPNGILSMTVGDNIVIAVPGNVAGSVIVDNHSMGCQHIITAHTTALAAIALNSDGTRLATASERGTLIRIWDTVTGEMVREFRRGLDTVKITSLTFDLGSTRLAVCSDKGTLHIFSLIQGVSSSSKELNKKSSLAYIGEYLPSYFSSEWSSVSFDVPDNSMCTFSSNSNDTVYVITPQHKFLKYVYNTKTSEGHCMEIIDIHQLSGK